MVSQVITFMVKNVLHLWLVIYCIYIVVDFLLHLWLVLHLWLFTITFMGDAPVSITCWQSNACPYKG